MTEHLIDRPASYQPCPRCARHTLTAYVGGLKIRADPQPLGINQEIAALLTGRSTYDVLIFGLPRRMHLEWRDISRIRAAREHAVIADHQCTPLPVRPVIQPETGFTIPAPKPAGTGTVPF